MAGSQKFLPSETPERPPLNCRIRHEVCIAEPHLQHTQEGEYIAKVLGAAFIPVTRSRLLSWLMKQEDIPVSQRVRENAVAIISEFPKNYGFSSDRKWIAPGAWCREDIIDALQEMDITITDELVNAVLEALESEEHSLEDLIGDVGFDYICDIAQYLTQPTEDPADQNSLFDEPLYPYEQAPYPDSAFQESY